MEKCHVIAVTNQKGGVGKTTTTVNLGVGLARMGKRVLLVDADPQGSLTVSLGVKNPDELPVSIATVMQNMALGSGNEWQMIFVLSGLYGLRRNEVLGLRWDNVDLKNRQFSITEQLPFKVPPKTTVITEMAPTKSQGRTLPITEVTLSFFQKQLSLQQKQKELSELSGQPYYDNRLVIAKANGAPTML